MFGEHPQHSRPHRGLLPGAHKSSSGNPSRGSASQIQLLGVEGHPMASAASHLGADSSGGFRAKQPSGFRYSPDVAENNYSWGAQASGPGPGGQASSGAAIMSSSRALGTAKASSFLAGMAHSAGAGPGFSTGPVYQSPSFLAGAEDHLSYAPDSHAPEGVQQSGAAMDIEAERRGDEGQQPPQE